MKIKIKTDEGKKFMLWFPTVLFVNHVTALVVTSIANMKLKKSGKKIELEAVCKFVNIIYKYKLRGGGKLELVDIETRDTAVKIQI